MYYENYIIIEISIPNFEEIKKKYFDSYGNKLLILNNEFQLESPFEYFTPVIYADPSGNFAISLTLLGLITGAVIGAAAGGTIAYNVAKNNGKDGWELFGWTLLGALGGGLGAGIGATMLFGGVGNVVSEAFSGDITSFGDAMLQFTLGALTSGIAYGISKGISTKLASGKISKIIGPSAKNSKINANLVKNGFRNMKVGKIEIKNIAKELYKELGYENLEDGISYVLNFGMGLFF